jgi:hypothetical protein
MGLIKGTYKKGDLPYNCKKVFINNIEYNSIYEASRQTGYSRSNIHRQLRNIGISNKKFTASFI